MTHEQYLRGVILAAQIGAGLRPAPAIQGVKNPLCDNPQEASPLPDAGRHSEASETGSKKGVPPEGDTPKD